jgi:hypothetical protein
MRHSESPALTSGTRNLAQSYFLSHRERLAGKAQSANLCALFIQNSTFPFSPRR